SRVSKTRPHGTSFQDVLNVLEHWDRIERGPVADGCHRLRARGVAHETDHRERRPRVCEKGGYREHSVSGAYAVGYVRRERGNTDGPESRLVADAAAPPSRDENGLAADSLRQRRDEIQDRRALAAGVEPELRLGDAHEVGTRVLRNRVETVVARVLLRVQANP